MRLAQAALAMSLVTAGCASTPTLTPSTSTVPTPVKPTALSEEGPHIRKTCAEMAANWFFDSFRQTTAQGVVTLPDRKAENGTQGDSIVYYAKEPEKQEKIPRYGIALAVFFTNAVDPALMSVLPVYNLPSGAGVPSDGPVDFRADGTTDVPPVPAGQENTLLGITSRFVSGYNRCVSSIGPFSPAS